MGSGEPLGDRPDDVGPGNGLLDTRAQVAQRRGAVGQLVAADDERKRCATAVRTFELRLHGTTIEGTVGPDTGAPQLMREAKRLEPSGEIDHEHVDGDGGCAEDPLGIARREDAIDAEPEADAGRGRPAELLDEVVVVPTPANRVLCALEGIG